MNTRKNLYRKVGIALVSLGFDPRKILLSLSGAFDYLSDFLILRRKVADGCAGEFAIKFLPILSDKKSSSGIARGHYFHQDLWAAKKVYMNKPSQHIDIGSRIDGFVAHVLVFMECTVIDVRSLSTSLKGLKFFQADMMQDDGVMSLRSKSVSCLHALEHFGLGRYGDPIDIEGWRKGLINIAKCVDLGGTLYLSVPIGPQVIEFNAQRIFNPLTIINEAKLNGLQLKEFSFIDDEGNFHENTLIDAAVKCYYGCGCFEFIRPAI